MFDFFFFMAHYEKLSRDMIIVANKKYIYLILMQLVETKSNSLLTLAGCRDKLCDFFCSCFCDVASSIILWSDSIDVGLEVDADFLYNETIRLYEIEFGDITVYGTYKLIKIQNQQIFRVLPIMWHTVQCCKVSTEHRALSTCGRWNIHNLPASVAKFGSSSCELVDMTIVKIKTLTCNFVHIHKKNEG